MYSVIKSQDWWVWRAYLNMSMHYLKIEVTKYISSLLRIFKTAHENPTISWFNKEIQMTMPLVASTINNQLVFLFLCLVAAGGAFIWQKNQSPFGPSNSILYIYFFPKKKIQFRKPIVRNHSHIQSGSQSITMCMHIYIEVW